MLASESEYGKTFTKAVNQSEHADNPKKTEDATLLDVINDFAVWDPSGRKG